jgi:hypothetical protein
LLIYLLYNLEILGFHHLRKYKIKQHTSNNSFFPDGLKKGSFD